MTTSVADILRLFQHTELEHTPKPLPTGYKGIPFIIGERGLPGVCPGGVLQFSWRHATYP